MKNAQDILNMITVIPADTAAAVLSEKLQPVIIELAELSQSDPATASALLHHNIKTHFHLRATDIAAYGKMLKRLLPSQSKSKDTSGAETFCLVPNLIHWVNSSNGRVKYLLYNNGTMEIAETVTIEGKEYHPKQDLGLMLPNESILEIEYNHEPAQLLKDIESFLFSHIEMPDKSGYLILALWVIHTYLIEKSFSTPMLYFFGVKETGKSRAGQVLSHLAFRAEHITSVTEATIFREAELFKTVMVFDEIKLLGPKGNDSVESLLKSRYKRGVRVKRIDTNQKNKEDQVASFAPFGPLVMCTTEPIDHIIGSRCLKWIMEKNIRREVENDINEDHAACLRDRLIWFRKELFNTVLPHCKVPEPARRRFAEIIKPLYQMVMLCDPSRESEFIDFIKYVDAERKADESDTLDAEIIKEIVDYVTLNKVTMFSARSIADEMNKKLGKGDNFLYKDKYIASHIAKLKFTKGPRINARRMWTFTPEMLSRKIEQYDLKAPSNDQIEAHNSSKPQKAIKNENNEIPF